MLRRITYMQYKGIISFPRDLRKTALRQSKNHHSNHDSHPTRLSSFLYLQPLSLSIYLDPCSTKYASSIWFDCYLQSRMEISHHLDLHTFGRCSTRRHSVSLPKCKYLLCRHHCCHNCSMAPTVRLRMHPFARIRVCQRHDRLDNLTQAR